MEEKDIKSPFLREPWKRLLEAAGDAPPETTDARIRASARKAVTPHAARWWVHAGLAASFVVAVVIAQALLGGGGRDPVGESRVEVDLVDRPDSISPPPPPESAAAPLRKEAPRAAGRAPTVETDDYEESAVGELAEVEVYDSRIGGPERERRASSETPEEEFSDGAQEETADAPASNATQADVPAQGAAPSSGLWSAPVVLAAWQKTPEDWYDKIVELRKADRDEDADAELARFEAAWPDWMKQHGKPRP